MIRTNNEAWGFYGTEVSNGATEQQAAILFDQAARKLITLCGISEEQAAEYLDSRDGRHLADEIGRKSQLPSWVSKAVKSFFKKPSAS